MQGDSGGPAIHNAVQYGVVSGVLSGGCSAPNIPGLYAKVSSALPWIYNITGYWIEYNIALEWILFHKRIHYLQTLETLIDQICLTKLDQ